MSPMPRMKLRWHEYWIGSPQLVITGKPSAHFDLLAAVPSVMSLQAATLPWFLKYRITA